LYAVSSSRRPTLLSLAFASTRPTNGTALEPFSDSFTPAFYESRLLDAFGNSDTFRSWDIRTYHGADKLWHSYLAYRVRNETDPAVGRFVEIRQVAESLQRYTGIDSDLDIIIDSLCWLALERGGNCPGSRPGWASHDGRINEESNLGLNLLSAAAYLGYMPLVLDLLRQGYCSTKDNDLFPSPIRLAAWAGRADILEVLQEHLPDYDEFNPIQTFDGWRGKIGPGSVEGAAARGDLDMVCLAVYPPSRTVTSLDKASDIVDQKFGHVHQNSKIGFYLERGMRCTRSWDVYQYLGRFFEPGQGDDINFSLRFHVGAGNLDMVRHLLDAGADVVGREMPRGSPLVQAARACHEDVVDLLLARGADPNVRGLYRGGTVLTAAAKGGSLAILRKLLRAGARVVRGDKRTLLYAVMAEHTAMVELLLKMNIGDAKDRSLILGLALEGGLESMAEILQGWGASRP